MTRRSGKILIAVVADGWHLEQVGRAKDETAAAIWPEIEQKGV